MEKQKLILCVLRMCLILSLSAISLFAAKVKFVQTGDTWQLLRDGQPYFIKGAGGGSNLNKLLACGGNSVRTWGPSQYTLDEANKLNMTVCLGISAASVASARTQVQQYLNHPALLMWGIGNEEELRTSDMPTLWKRIDSIAQMIHSLDTNHPAITVVAGIGTAKINQLKQYAPNLDALGVNTYGDIMTLAAQIKSGGWTKAFIVTEFGPRGHWESPKESWGVPIEQTSTEKEDHYLKGYQASIQNQAACVGSYVFLWGQKQEKTHTWYGMFLPGDLGGNPVNPVDAMVLAWTGQKPVNSCPDIGPGKIKVGPVNAFGDGLLRLYPPSCQLKVEVDAADPDNDPIIVKWDLRYDVTNNTASGGAYEPPNPPIAGAVLSMTGKTAVIQLPAEEKRFRIHVYIYDDKGNAATANIGIDVLAKYASSVFMFNNPGMWTPAGWDVRVEAGCIMLCSQDRSSAAAIQDISLYNMLGKNVSRLMPLPLPGGAYTYRLDARKIGIGPGAYWLAVKTTAQGMKAEKINLMW